MISYLGIGSGGTSGNVDVAESRSTDGGLTWGNPVIVTSTGAFYDKNWTVCDNHSASAYYGHCYTEYDNNSTGDSEHMKTSTDGGLTWGSEQSPADNPSGLGGQPVVQPNGTVVVPFASGNENAERAFTSTDGGASWGSSVLIATVSHHPVSGLETSDFAKRLDSLREGPLPSAEIDASGKVYVTWSDCRFRSSCTSNDIIMSTSSNGTSWSSPTRVPIDAAGSTADHFTPGIGVDTSTSGASARIGLTYYYYPQAACSDTTCQLEVGFVSSTNGGSTWSTPTQLAGPMTLAWLPNTSQGRMFGDYISTSVLPGGNAYPVFPVAHAPNGSTFDVAMYAPTGGLSIVGAGGGGKNTVTVTNPGNQTGTVGTPVSLQITATDSSSTASLSYTAAGLPAGLSINSGSGLISGTPTKAGTSNVTVTATDNTGATGTTSFTWTITAKGQLSVTNPGDQTGTVGKAVSLQIQASGGTTPYAYAANGLPTGLSIDSKSGLISGTPTTAGTYAVVVTVTDATGTTGQAKFNWTINPGQTSQLSATFTTDFDYGTGAFGHFTLVNHGSATVNNWAISFDIPANESVQLANPGTVSGSGGHDTITGNFPIQAGGSLQVSTIFTVTGGSFTPPSNITVTGH